MRTQKSEGVLFGPNGEALIRKTPGVCGGDACIRMTRIPISTLVEARQQGATDQRLLESFGVSLTQADLDAAWVYYKQHQQEIDREIWEDQACMVERSDAPLPTWLIVIGRRLGLSDDRIGEAFHPSLTSNELQAGWEYYGKHAQAVEQEVRRQWGT
ncbi:MAG: DUF433 domain-containing protein [Gemmataceae bacterium]|nr:DUF433 domain-containing protein [Gemmataceae bacterium]